MDFSQNERENKRRNECITRPYNTQIEINDKEYQRFKNTLQRNNIK